MQVGALTEAMHIVTPFWNGSDLDARKVMLIELRLPVGGLNSMALHERCTDGFKAANLSPFTQKSPAHMKAEKASLTAASVLCALTESEGWETDNVVEDIKGDRGCRAPVVISKIPFDPLDEPLSDWGLNCIDGEVCINMHSLDMAEV